jgi:diguanylate cyclase (GGDEF)-like protein
MADDPTATDPTASDPIDARAVDAVALGAAFAAAEAAQAAGDLAQGLTAAEQAWALTAGGSDAERLRAGQLLMHFRYRSGLLAALIDVGLDVLALMRRAELPATVLIDTLRMVVLGAADVGRFDVAMSLGHEAYRLASEGGDKGRLSLATNALGCVYDRLGDPWHAERLLLDALTIAQEAGATHAGFTALNNVTATLVSAYYLMLGNATPAEIERPLQRAVVHAEAALQTALALDDPFYLSFVRGNYGEVLLHLGRTQDARRELEAARLAARGGGFDAQAWRIDCAWGELLLREGDPAGASAVLRAVLQESAAADARMTHLRLHHALWRAERAQGRAPQALDHLERYQQLERGRMLIQLRGHSQLFVTKVEAEQVRLEARRAGERAVQAEVSARVDQLTGLGNRRELDLRWPPMVQRLQAAQLPLAVMMVDLDHFKQVNDRFGHAAGDSVLTALAKLLRENTRGDDLIIRIGGEEFLLALPEMEPERALEAGERLRQRVSQHSWELLMPGLQVTLSVGLATAPPYDLRSLIQRADAALYRAKGLGRNRVQLG